MTYKGNFSREACLDFRRACDVPTAGSLKEQVGFVENWAVDFESLRDKGGQSKSPARET